MRLASFHSSLCALLLVGACATPARSVPSALDPANPDAEESAPLQGLTPLVQPGPDTTDSMEGAAHSGHDMAGMKPAAQDKVSPQGGHDMAGMKPAPAAEKGTPTDKASPHGGHDMAGMKPAPAAENGAPTDKASPHGGHDMAGAPTDKASPHGGHDMAGMKQSEEEEHLKGVITAKKQRSLTVTLEDSSVAQILTTPETLFERGDAKADLMAVKPGERVVVYATRKDGKWLARVVKLSTAQPKDAGSSAPDTAAQEYTCPMHPEVRSPTPGKCPKCGMTLQPMRKR